MASETTKNLELTVYSDITNVYQRELRQSYLNNFLKIDAAYKELEDELKQYINDMIGEIENGYY